jgi:histidyl-tRNA synthetase
LEQLGISEYEVDFGIVRGLDYYTWTVFETFIDEERNLWSIASGGRYENFTKFIEPKTNFSGVGGSIWVSRLESFIFDKIQLNQKTTSEYLILNFPETTTQCLGLFSKFLKEWKKVEFYPSPDKFKKQLKYADKKWIKYCIILGENELNENCYILKNMETWEQEKIPLK